MRRADKTGESKHILSDCTFICGLCQLHSHAMLIHHTSKSLMGHLNKQQNRNRVSGTPPYTCAFQYWMHHNGSQGRLLIRAHFNIEYITMGRKAGLMQKLLQMWPNNAAYSCQSWKDTFCTFFVFFSTHIHSTPLMCLCEAREGNSQWHWIFCRRSHYIHLLQLRIRILTMNSWHMIY